MFFFIQCITLVIFLRKNAEQITVNTVSKDRIDMVYSSSFTHIKIQNLPVVERERIISCLALVIQEIILNVVV